MRDKSCAVGSKCMLRRSGVQVNGVRMRELSPGECVGDLGLTALDEAHDHIYKRECTVIGTPPSPSPQRVTCSPPTTE